MIKGGSYLKLFVLSLFTLLISCFTFGVNFSDSAYIRQIGYYGYNPYSQSVNININRNGGFLSETAGYTKAIFVLNDGENNKSYFWWTNNGIPYYYGYWSILGSAQRYYQKKEGYLKTYFTCSEIIAESNSLPSNCVEHSVSDSTPYVFANFLSNVSSTDYFAFDVYTNSSYNSNIGYKNDTLCISSSSLGSSICFRAGVYIGNQNYVPSSSYQNYVGYYNGANFDLGANLDWLSISSSLLKNPPNINNVSGDSVINTSTGVNATLTGNLVYMDSGTPASAISYYETKYGWNESICYAGVDNLTSLFGASGVSFEEGTGLSIFEVFNGIYGNTDLNKVYVWLNSWLINVGQWYYTEPDDRIYLASYDSTNNKVNLRYNLLTTNPFLGNPVAIYFLADNIYYHSPYKTMGSSVVSYCNLKLNHGNFDSIIDESDKNNINGYTEQYNIQYNLNQGNNYSSVDWFGIGDMGNGSGMTTTQNGKTFISDFFNKVKSSITVPDKSDFGLGILPSYIIWAFLGIIFFNFLRK